MSTHDSALDGCPDFDAALLESAFAPTIDARLDAHLASCPRCRKARDRYLRTNDALSAALAIGGPERSEPRERSAAGARGVSKRAFAFAAVVIALVAGLSAFVALRRPRVEWTPLGAGTEVVFSSSERAFMRSGRARFDVARGEVEIATPQGVARASDALFTLSVKNEGEADLNVKKVGVVVAASVVAGVVWFVSPDGRETRVVAGETLVSPRPSVSAALALEKSPGVNVEAGSLAASSTQDARRSVPDLAIESAALPVLIGTVVDDATEQPIAGVEIVCTRRGESDAYLARASSDALGHFIASFEAVAPAELDRFASDRRAALSFRARHADYAPSYDAPWEVRGEQAPQPAPNGRTDVGLVRLARGASITGRVTTQAGAGVADAQLFVFDDGVDYGNFLAAAARSIGTTDAGGRIRVPERLAGALHGNWVLCASSSLGIGWTPLPIVAGRERVDDLAIVIGPAFTLEVEARDEQGRPVEGVAVQISPRFAPFSGRDGYGASSFFPALAEPVRALFSATTDGAGRAHFAALPLVQATAGVTAEIFAGYDGFDVVGEHPSYARAVSDPKRGVEELRAGATEHVSLTLESLHPLRVSGKVVDEAGAPVRDALVRNERGASARADATGAFTLEDPSGRESSWKLHASADGFVDADELVHFGEGWTRADEMLLVLHRALPIAGLVVDDLGQPVVGARISGMQDGVFLSVGPEGKFATTDAAGRFALPYAFAGEWELELLPPEPFDAWVPFTRMSTYGGTRDVQLVLRRVRSMTSEVEVDIVDADTGAPLDALDQRFVPHDPLTQGAVDAERSAGKVVAKRVSAGAWRVWVQVAERPAAWVDIEVNGAPAHARVAVGRFAGLTGRIALTERLGEKARGVSARHVLSEMELGGGVWDAGAKRWAWSELGADGSFAFEALMPGAWIVAWQGRTELVEERIELRQGETRSVVLRPTLGVHVVFHGSLPTTDGLVFVNLTNLDDSEHKAGETGDTSTGSYTVEMLLTPGHWRYEIEQRDHSQVGEKSYVAQTAKGEIVVTAGESPTVEVPLIRR